METREPVRRCIGCRSVREKGTLLRYVLSPGGEVVLDYNMKLSGRGSYLCPEVECLKRAVKERSFQRAFKSGISKPVELDGLVETIKARACEKIGSYLSFAVRSRKAALGTVAVEGGLGKDRIRLVLLRSDMSMDALDRWKVRLQNKGIACRVIAEFPGLESIVGHRKVIGVLDRGLTHEIIHQVERVEKIQSNMPV